MHNLFTLVIITSLLVLGSINQQKSDREKDQLIGPVKSIKSQWTRLYARNGQENAEGLTKQMGTVTYDTQGNEIESVIYDDYGYLVGKEVHTYTQGKRVKSTLLDEKGSILTRSVYSYRNDTLYQILIDDAVRRSHSSQINSFDKNSSLIEERYFEGQKPIGKTIYKYNEKDRVSEAAFY